MARISANIECLWADMPWLDRFDAAAEAGFHGVEGLSPYELPGQETQQALLRNGLSYVMLGAPPPNYVGGDRGFAAVPALSDRFAYDMRRACRYASLLKVPFINVLTGPGDSNDPQARDTLVANLRAVSGTLPDGVSLLLEPLCRAAAPGCYLSDLALAADIVAEADLPNLSLLFDSFHVHHMAGDVPDAFRRFAHVTGHVQLSDAPIRSAPGTGEIDFAALTETILDTGYSGWIGVEFPRTAKDKTTWDWLDTLSVS
jgi:hydroxypyruvate isomerase